MIKFGLIEAGGTKFVIGTAAADGSILARHRSGAGGSAAGGGVMATPDLPDRVVTLAREWGGGYFPGAVEEIVVRPGLDGDSGLLGALEIAREALGQR